MDETAPVPNGPAPSATKRNEVNKRIRSRKKMKL